MKTILEWYEELPEPIRSQAIANYPKHKPEWSDYGDTIKNVEEAIDAFDWFGTNEGFGYWHNVYYKAKAGEYENKPPLEQALTEALKSLNELKTALEEVRKAIGNESN